MYSILAVFLGSLLFVVLLLLIMNDGVRKVLSTFFVFSVLYIISYFFVPAYSDLYEYSRYGILYSEHAKYFSLIYSFLLYFFVLLLYFLVSKKIQPVSVREIKELNKTKLYFFGLFCILLCSASLVKMTSIILSYGLNVFLSNRIVLTSGLGYFQLLLYLPLLWAIAFSIEKFYLREKSTKLSFIYGAVIVSIASVPLVVLGSRSNVLFGLIIYAFSILILLLKTGQVDFFKVKFKRTIIVVSVLIFIGASLGEVRQKLMAEDDSYYVASVEKMPFESVVKAFSSYENLYWFFSDENYTQFQYGGTFLSVLVGPVPRSLWESKPTGGGPIMKNHISPGSYDLLAGEKISSYTTGLPAEAYLNFGWFGVLLVPFLIVSIICVHERFMFNANSVIEIVVSSALLLRIIGFVNAEFYGVFIHIFVILFFFFFFKFFQIKVSV